MRAPLVFLSIALASAAVRPVPPPGIAVSAEDQAQLRAALERLDKSIASLVSNGEFFKPEEIGRAKGLLVNLSRRRSTGLWPSVSGGLLCVVTMCPSACAAPRCFIRLGGFA